jgi:L-ascorbate metabolism protein UlaG (beta-lactamase superfamily)
LIQIGNLNIITDPIFGDASFFYPRILPPGIILEDLPKIDVVLLSHNHRDHMDAKSLLALKNRSQETTFLVPKGDKAWFDKRNFEHCSEYTWWDYTSVESPSQCGQVTFSFLPAVHWSQRGLFDKNRSLWGSWLIEWGSQTIYFAGDTAYSQHFEIIAQECSAITTALMPIGPCDPEPHMRKNHVNAQEAVKGFIDLQAQQFVPMHWGTFQFGTDLFDTPINRLQTWWQQQEMLDRVLHIPKAGQIITL